MRVRVQVKNEITDVLEIEKDALKRILEEDATRQQEKPLLLEIIGQDSVMISEWCRRWQLFL